MKAELAPNNRRLNSIGEEKSRRNLAAMLFTTVAVSSCQTYQTTSELETQLLLILQEKVILWNTAREFGGTTNGDLTAEVCPLVSKMNLEDLLERNPKSFRFEFQVFNAHPLFPDKTGSWEVSRQIGVLQRQILSITVAPDGECIAFYQHRSI